MITISMVIGLLLAGAVAAPAQTTTTSSVPETTTTTTPASTTTTLPPLTHQRCYKAADALKLRSADPAWLATLSTQLGNENCRITGGTRYVCVPVTVDAVGEVEGSIARGPYAPVTRTPLATQQAITQERICYKVKCVDRPTINEDTILVTDEYATRQVSSFRSGLVCGPMIRATCGNGTVDFGEDCDDGNNVDKDCCSALCLAEPAGKVTACVDNDGNTCTEAACDGSGHCSQTAILPPDTKSCTDSDANACTTARCDGTGVCNQSAILQPTTTACAEADGNDCTQARCDGAGVCIQTAIVLADGATCGDTDGNACTRALCATGACAQGNALAAGALCPEGDGDQCTTAGCDGAGTCDQDFFVRNCTLPLVCNSTTGACE
jgi:cysteine-rich repeat protein